jgi:hypothetical protein
MGETIFRISLGDIQSIRIKCKHNGCEGSLDFPLGKLGKAMANNLQCPCCSAAWWVTQGSLPSSPPEQSPFFDLQRVLEWAQKQIGFAIELIVPKSAIDERPATAIKTV